MNTTRMMADILRQPAELRGCLQRLRDDAALRSAGRLLAKASDIVLVGIGASYHAALAAAPLAGRPIFVADASELPAQTAFRPGTVFLALSRSGKSVELVALLEQARRHGFPVVAVTNAPESPLGRGAAATIALGVGFDHAVSIVTYSAVALGAALVLSAAADHAVPDLEAPLTSTERAIPGWRRRLEAWTPPPGPAYFLGRGPGFGSAREARLLWEEAAKSPATALTTGEFRHGPQEIVGPGMLAGLWLDPERRREEDLLLSRELATIGAQVLLVGQDLPDDALSFALPRIDPAWQFLVDVVPAQLAAERAARATKADCDTFRLCSYVVESERGLISPVVKGETP
jgi:glucosamine--fructose-6-phosphate aminotransferase (isomerizing)